MNVRFVQKRGKFLTYDYDPKDSNCKVARGKGLQRAIARSSKLIRTWISG